MNAAKADFAVLTCYRRTISFVRDQVHDSVLYNSSIYTDEHPLLLYYVAFLVMAIVPDFKSFAGSGSGLIKRHRVPEVADELKKVVNRVKDMEGSKEEDSDKYKFGII